MSISKLLAGVVLVCLLAGPAAAQLARAPAHRLVAHVVMILTQSYFVAINTTHHDDTEAAVQEPVPVNGIFKELRCRMSTALASDESWTLSLRINGVSTALACTIGASGQSCTDLGNTVPVSVGDLMNLLADNTAGASPSANPHCTLTLYEYF